MNLAHMMASPIPWIMLVLGFFVFFQLRYRSRRQEKLRALIAKYGLLTDQSRWTDADPAISGWFFPAIYPLWLEGWVGDVRVVAFDYEIGFGRNSRVGSGVGIKRQVKDLRPLISGMNAQRNGEWTFLFTKTSSLRNGKLDPDEMERLWFELLEASGIEETGPPAPVISRPGEVHLRPRRLAKL